ncbi:tryptophan 7-halogenase [Pelagerythrobacter sp.]|uniref:tryptophan 7-halogenase n=1 Tax=Pelagerythrobacter sp. TaxID=2800702 RepID=UPI0035B42E2E
MNGAVRQVVVHGGGIAAPMAALALARAFGRVGTAVTWIDTGDEASPHEALIAPPELAAFHRLLGIADEALVRRASGTIAMGQQFVGWSGGAGDFLHAYGDAGRSYASLPFIQHWARARQAGLKVALEDFCLAAAAARQGRTRVRKPPDAQPAVKHGWHLHAAAYAGLLRTACEREGVRIVAGPCAASEAADGHLRAITVDGGERLEAELFIDADGALADAAGGPDAISAPPSCDRLLRASGPALDPMPLYSRIAAHGAGWMAVIPLRDRTAYEFVYSSPHMDDDEARHEFGAMSGGPMRVAEVPETLAMRHRPAPWQGNVVAIGRAAGLPVPLDGADMLLLQLAIAQLVLLWPIDAAAMPEADIYNEEMAGSRTHLGEFTALHFRLADRAGEPFWEAARAREISPELAARIDLFAARGIVAQFSHEALVEDSWSLCLTGHGIVPRSFDPQALAVDEQALIAEFQRQLRGVADAVNAMPTHAEVLRGIAG